MKVLNKERQIITVVKDTLTANELAQAYNDKEELSGFIGGVEVDVDVIDEVIPSVVFQTESYTWKDLFPTFISLDGTKAMIKIAKGYNGKNWYNGTDKELYPMIDYFGMKKILRKNDYNAKIIESYTKVSEE